MPIPYILCHMLTSLDGKVTGNFLSRPECEAATEIYYELNREYKAQGSGGFICGRVTMEESFTGGAYPDLSQYEPAPKICGQFSNFWPDQAINATYFAIAFDPKGKLGWKSNVICDSDPGYDGATIVEVLTEQVDPRYLSYLEEKEIAYFFAGKTEINVPVALSVLYTHLSPEFYILEGGSIINGSFLRADCIDEISLVTVPTTADKDSKSIFTDGETLDFKLNKAEQRNGVLVTRYIRIQEE